MNILTGSGRRFFAEVGLIALMGLSSCVNDPTENFNVSDPDDKGITVNLAVPGMTAVSTRAINPDEINSLHLIVYDDEGNKLMADDNVELLGMGTGKIMQAYVLIPKTVTLAGPFQMVFIANAPPGLATWIMAGGTNNLTKTQLLDHTQWAENYARPYMSYDSVYGIQMYGETQFMNALPESNTALNVDMVRAFAAIDFDFAPSLADYYVDLPYLSGFTSKAYIAGRENSSTTDYPVSATVYLSLFENRYPDAIFYVMEQSAVDNTSIDTYIQSPHLVIGINKYGLNAGSRTYYRIDITSDGSTPGYAKGEYMPIIRNHKYLIKIKEILGPGYGTLEKASASRGELNNIVYDVQVVDEGDERGTVLYDGHDRLEVNLEDDITLTGVGEAYGKKLDLLYTYDDSFTDTPHNKEWKIDIKTDNVDGKWLTVKQGSDALTGTVSGPAGIPAELLIYANSANSTKTTERTGTITVTADRMVYTITVTQPANRTGNIRVETSQPLLDGRKDIVFYSWQGREFAGDTEAQIYVEWNGDETVCTVQNSTNAINITGNIIDPFPFKTTDGFADIKTSATTMSSSPALLKVGSSTFPTSVDGDIMRGSSLIFRTQAPAEAGNTEVRVMIKNYYVKTVREEPYVVSHGDFMQRIAMEHNTSEFTIEPYEYPEKLLRFGPPPVSFSDEFDIGGITDTPLNYARAFPVYEFNLPTLYPEDFEALGLPNPLTLKFKVTAKPNTGAPDLNLEDIIEVKVVPYGGDANSYIMKPNTYIGIPAKRASVATGIANWLAVGNADAKGLVAKLLWADNMSYSGTNRVVYEPLVGGTGKNEEAYVVVHSGATEGNAVVTITSDNSNQNNSQIRWSWHIWVTPDKDVIEAGYGTGNKWMDRNIGAILSDTEITGAITQIETPGFNGMAYQWGRKDPLPKAAGYYLAGTDNMSFGNPNSSDVIDPTITNLKTSIYEPRKIAPSGWFGSWAPYGSNQNNSWRGKTNGTPGAGKTLFDPCPEGWRVPTLDELPPQASYDVLFRPSNVAGNLPIPTLMRFDQGTLPTLPLSLGFGIDTSDNTMTLISGAYCYLFSTDNTATNVSPVSAAGTSLQMVRFAVNTSSSTGWQSGLGTLGVSNSNTTVIARLRCIRE